MGELRRTRVILHLASDLDPIRGELEIEDQPLVFFTGWLQLIHRLTAAVDATASEATGGDQAAE
jgi:hypothetical protein